MRLIDADALIDKYAGWVNVYSPKPGGKESLRVVTTQEIGYVPTIDAIPVEWIRNIKENLPESIEKMGLDAVLILWAQEQEAG